MGLDFIRGPERGSQCGWLRVVRIFSQPMTATQLSHKLSTKRHRISRQLRRLTSDDLVYCLNPVANRNRVNWLTQAGTAAQQIVVAAGTPIAHDYPDIDWELYGNICFSHRSEVIKNLSIPMQPSHIKRRASFRKPGIRMSANNVRDVIRFLKTHDIVRPVALKKGVRLAYELTAVGEHMRRLLLQAEVRA